MTHPSSPESPKQWQHQDIIPWWRVKRQLLRFDGWIKCPGTQWDLPLQCLVQPGVQPQKQGLRSISDVAFVWYVFCIKELMDMINVIITVPTEIRYEDTQPTRLNWALFKGTISCVQSARPKKNINYDPPCLSCLSGFKPLQLNPIQLPAANFTVFLPFVAISVEQDASRLLQVRFLKSTVQTFPLMHDQI